MEPRILKTKDETMHLGCSKSKLARMARAGKIGHISDGENSSAFRSYICDLDAYPAENYIPAKGGKRCAKG